MTRHDMYISIVACMMLLLLTLLTSCSSAKPIATHDHDSLRVEYHLDSVYVYERDSVFMFCTRSNDTVYLTTDRWHVRWRDREVAVHDTITATTTDTQVVTERYIPSFYKWCTGLFIGTLCLLLIYAGVRIYLRVQSGGLLR